MQGLRKNTKLINVGPTFIQDYRVLKYFLKIYDSQFQNWMLGPVLKARYITHSSHVFTNPKSTKLRISLKRKFLILSILSQLKTFAQIVKKQGNFLDKKNGKNVTISLIKSEFHPIVVEIELQNVMQIANITLPRVKASGAENPFLKPIRQKTLSVKCDQGKTIQPYDHVVKRQKNAIEASFHLI